LPSTYFALEGDPARSFTFTEDMSGRGGENWKSVGGGRSDRSQDSPLIGGKRGGEAGGGLLWGVMDGRYEACSLPARVKNQNKMGEEGKNESISRGGCGEIIT